MLGNLLSGGAADLVKNVGGVIDNLHTSEEEKLEAERKIKELVAGVIGAYFGGRSLEKVKK